MVKKITVTIEEEKRRKKHPVRTSNSPKRYPCVWCGETGRERWGFGKSCTVCGGTGIRPSNLTRRCPACGGTGKDPYRMKCPRCKGHGFVKP